MSAQHVFSALADPTRRLLIEKLTEEGARTATQLADELPITRQGITKHLNILAEAELVKIRQDGRDKYYYLNPAPLEEATHWMTVIAARWDERLTALSEFLESEENDDDSSI